jgi:transposase
MPLPSLSIVDHVQALPSEAACSSHENGARPGVESLRQWTVQAQIEAQVPGPTTIERQRIKDLEREVRT